MHRMWQQAQLSLSYSRGWRRWMVIGLCCWLGLVTYPLNTQPLIIHAQDGTSSHPTNVMIHVVQRGDTMFSIAQQYGTTIEAILAANDIQDPARLSIGQRILIPNAMPTKPGIPTTYIIQPGDSLLSLSYRYGTTVQQIAAQNFITNPTALIAGMQLSLQLGSLGVSSIQHGRFYIVQADDTLYRLAARYHISLAQLMKANRLQRPSTLFKGQRLVIPVTEGPLLVDLPQPLTSMQIEPTVLEQGRTFVLHLSTETPSTINGTFLETPLRVISDTTRTVHTILIGVDSLTPTGLYALQLSIQADNTPIMSYTQMVEIQNGGYTSEVLTLDPSLSDLLNPKITNTEAQQVKAIVSQFTPQRYYVAPLGLPCSAPVSSQFGTRRNYNDGALTSVHTGVDFAGAPGSPILAPAAGVVVWAGPLTVRGNAVIIDHGWGIFTGYWHQQEILVKQGDVVQLGQTIGTIGSTGRITGPHLHWELFVNGVPVDPLPWVRTNFS